MKSGRKFQYRGERNSFIDTDEPNDISYFSKYEILSKVLIVQYILELSIKSNRRL